MRLTPRLRVLLAFVCALVLVDTIFFTALTPLLPHYASADGLSKAGAGLLVAAYPLGTLAGSLQEHQPASTAGGKLIRASHEACRRGRAVSLLLSQLASPDDVAVASAGLRPNGPRRHGANRRKRQKERE